MSQSCSASRRSRSGRGGSTRCLVPRQADRVRQRGHAPRARTPARDAVGEEPVPDGRHVRVRRHRRRNTSDRAGPGRPERVVPDRGPAHRSAERAQPRTERLHADTCARHERTVTAGAPEDVPRLFERGGADTVAAATDADVVAEQARQLERDGRASRDHQRRHPVRRRSLLGGQPQMIGEQRRDRARADDVIERLARGEVGRARDRRHDFGQAHLRLRLRPLAHQPLAPQPHGDEATPPPSPGDIRTTTTVAAPIGTRALESSLVSWSTGDGVGRSGGVLRTPLACGSGRGVAGVPTG